MPPEYEFHAAPFDTRGKRVLLLPLRLLLRKLLVPLWQRQVELFRHLGGEVEALKARQDRLDALATDVVALTRRLAALEEHIEELLQRDREARPPAEANGRGKRLPAPVD
jgi:hypothetical protein